MTGVATSELAAPSLTAICASFVLVLVIIGWLALKGRAILGQYLDERTPSLLAIIVLAVVVSVAVIGVGQYDTFVAVSAPLSVVFAFIVMVDVEVHRIPTALTIAGALTIVVATGVTMIGDPEHVRVTEVFANMALGALIWLAPLSIAHFASRGGHGMGLGDVKLAPVVGAWLGAYGAPVALAGLLLAFVIGGFTVVALLVSRRATLRSSIPFAPLMLAGATTAWLATIGRLDMFTSW